EGGPAECRRPPGRVGQCVRLQQVEGLPDQVRAGGAAPARPLRGDLPRRRARELRGRRARADRRAGRGGARGRRVSAYCTPKKRTTFRRRPLAPGNQVRPFQYSNKLLATAVRLTLARAALRGPR